MTSDDRYKLHLMSWNIQSAIDGSSKTSKANDSDFISVVSKNDIICLQETIKDVKIPGFRSYSSLRPGTNVNHGGVVSLVSNHLQGGVRRVKNVSTSPDFVILKLCKNFFHTDKDIFLINAYISPKNSSYYTSINYDPYAELNSVVQTLHATHTCHVSICGDLNSRLGNNLDWIPESNSSQHLPAYLNNRSLNDMLTHRNHRDKISNNYSTDFSDFLLGNHLHIANGRVLGDIFGEMTCIKYNGASTVDYFLLPPELLIKAQDFTVQPFTIFSDHRPIRLRLSLLDKIQSIELCEEETFAIPKKYKTNPEGLQELPNLFNSRIDDATAILNDQTTDTRVLGTIITAAIQNVADSCFGLTKPPSSIKNNHNKPWQDSDCKSAKKTLSKKARTTGKLPENEYLRKQFYQQKKTYRKLINEKRRTFEREANKSIEDGKNINWAALKKIKSLKSENIAFDNFDIKTFKEFFSTLYNDEHSTVNAEQKRLFAEQAEAIQTNTPSSDQDILDELNAPISLEELDNHIKQLKTGKSCGEDRISNEILKALNKEYRMTVLKLFNLCLSNGEYPWNNSIITPLHKNGSKFNPDNYRAIAVGSCFGKLLSSILLSRIVEFKIVKCPDPINQMGFTKEAQTLDHIFAIKTISDKYKRKKQKVFCTFVDFRKAFDSVCRQALLLKLSMLGITGNIYNVIKNMYASSSCQLKMSNRLSSKIRILKGTEQGHTLSPELFKIFLHDLSDLLDRENCPTLCDAIISHLLWADDLVLMALDRETAQDQLDSLALFCNKWGLEINYSKTKTVIFNDTSKKKSYTSQDTFTINSNHISVVEEYTYLGITLHRNGSFKTAIDSLRKKGLRALFSLRRYADRNVLSSSSLTKLFDTLVRPVTSYGAPIWMPYSNCIPDIIALSDSNLITSSSSKKLLDKLARYAPETIHIRHLKWCLGVHRKTSNIATWGEFSRVPTLISHIKQTLTYFDRIDSLHSSVIVNMAFREQKRLNLDWYSRASTLATTVGAGNISPLAAKHFYGDLFKSVWNSSRKDQTKLDTYNTIKDDFASPSHLGNIYDHSSRATITRLRTSSHMLHIETGRYSHLPRNQRFCKWCSDNGNGNIIESEDHFLIDCDINKNTRDQLKLLFVDTGSTLTFCTRTLLNDVFETNNAASNTAARLITKMNKVRSDYMKSTTNTSNSVSTDHTDRQPDSH